MAIKIKIKEVMGSMPSTVNMNLGRSFNKDNETTTYDKRKTLEEDNLDEKRKKKKKKKKKKGKKDRCYRIAKRKYDVFPSAYASGAIVKCRQGKIWRGIKEVLSEDQFAPHMMYNPKTGDKIMTKKHGEHLDLAKKGYTHVDPKEIEKALKKEGGAAGLDAIVKITGGEEKEVKISLKHMPNVGKHKKGDYILDDDEEVEIVKEGITVHLSEILDEKKRKKSVRSQNVRKPDLNLKKNLP